MNSATMLAGSSSTESMLRMASGNIGQNLPGRAGTWDMTKNPIVRSDHQPGTILAKPVITDEGAKFAYLGVTSSSPGYPLSNLPKDHPVRVRMRSLVEQELRQRNPNREDWQQKCTEMAGQLEEVIYRSAKTFHEYRDESTLSLRLVEIFMAKKKRELSLHSPGTVGVGGATAYHSILECARTRWLTGEEIFTLFVKCSPQMPQQFLVNDSAFRPVSGTIFHFGAPVHQDGYAWLRQPMLHENGFMLNMAGHPRVWVSLNLAVQEQMHRRTYRMVDHASYGVLVHYLNTIPKYHARHSPHCFCLACLFNQEQENASAETSSSKRVRND